MGRYEWIILEVGFVGLLVWELWRVRRDIRRAREADKAAQSGQPAGGSGATPSAAPGTAASPGPRGG